MKSYGEVLLIRTPTRLKSAGTSRTDGFRQSTLFAIDTATDAGTSSK
ncbi:MAG: hypothetical protein HGA97_04675 [Chlorobiaceae bacterium]|nr:hypothetical protein [Chlorobiaceae bacterium]